VFEGPELKPEQIQKQTKAQSDSISNAKAHPDTCKDLASKRTVFLPRQSDIVPKENVPAAYEANSQKLIT